MKITFKNNVVTVYSAEDAAVFKPYMLENMKHVCISDDSYILPDHFYADVEKIIDDLYYEKEGCIGCGDDRLGGAAGYCAGCWNDVFGCEDDS